MKALSPTLKRALVALVASTAAQHAAAQWVTTTLDRPGAAGTQLWGINDLGQIAGADSLGGFIYSDGVATDLPALAGSSRTAPFGISNAGTVVGSWVSAADSLTHGFVYQQGSYTTWDVPQAGVNFTQIRSISLDGRYLAGYYTLAGVTGNKGFVYDTSLQALTTLQTTQGNAILQGTNSAGLTSGNRSVPPAQGASGGVVMAADGSVAVYASVPGVTGRTSFRGINDSGMVVGYAIQADGSNLAFMGNPLGTADFLTLAMPGAVTTTAEGLNNQNSMVGFYTDADQLTHGFLATAVPEPVTALLLACGLLGLRVQAGRSRVAVPAR